MKKKISLVLLFTCSLIFSQKVVINDRLLIQLQKNQLARVTSEKNFMSSYSKQKAFYEDAQKKVAKVLAIQEYIYTQLHNVNSLFNQGAKVKYIYEDLKIIGENSHKILQLSIKLPQYQVFILREYEDIIARSITLKKFIEENILKKHKDVLMDAYERDEILEELRIQVYTLRGYTYYILGYLENAKKTPYLLHFNEIGGYINLDKMIVSEIIRGIKDL